MSESAAGTPATELNAAQATARVAQASAVNAEQSASKTPATRKPSAATRKANATKTPASKTPATRKPAAAKVTKIAKTPAGPTATSQNRELGTMIIKAMADLASTRKLPAGMTREAALAQVGKWASYLPGSMDSRLVASSAGGRRKVA